jgi:diguanylate cyclase (GGDEF)-like protein/PAS domain S-box-containing protein
MDKKKQAALARTADMQTSRSNLSARERAENDLSLTTKALEEKSAELDHSLSMLRAVIEAAPDGLLVTDESGNVLCFNQLYLKMWCIPRELVEAGKHQMLIQYCGRYLEDPQQLVLSTEKIYTAWPPESFNVLEFSDGRVFEQYTKVKFVEGRNVGRVWNFRDVTERKQAYAYKAQLAAIVESSNDAIIVKNLDGIITSWNASAERMFGYRAHEIIGCPITKLIPLDRLEEESRIMNLIKNGKVSEHFETVRWAKDRKPIDVSVTISPVKDVTGRIVGASKIARDITQSKESQERIQYLAYYDSLTGLPNRSLLADRMKLAIGNAQRYSTRMAVLFMDLDRFKLVNDSLGHEIGDKLLKIAAKRMQSTVRLTDTVSRMGGDEFIVLLSRIEALEDAARISEKLITAVSQPYTIEQHELALTTSIGISVYPDHGKDASTLVRNADASMYSAKEAGRNQYQFYSKDSTYRATERLGLERDLRGAMERDEFFLVYQPQIELATGRVIGAEAFIRWQHPRRGVVAPENFIRVAEESGLILPLGQRVLHACCLQAHQWSTDGFNICVAVNISAVQFRKEDFTTIVLRALADTALSPECLELELTESAAMQDVESTVQKMRILDAHGISVAIDDFGTGYSSLSYLRQFTVDRLKIDRSFIHDLPENTDAKAIVSAIVAMGRSLGLRVMAEGVETNAQASFLQSIQCAESQGYLYAKPMLAKDFEVWLAARKLGISSNPSRD